MKVKKVSILFLVAALVLSLAMPAVAASHQDLTLVINGVDLSADIYVEDARAQISNQFLNQLPGFNIKEAGFTPLREFFEADGATVKWNASTRTIDVAWRGISGDWTARNLMLRSNELLTEYNTYQMTGSMVMEMTFDAPEMEMPTVPMTVTFNAAMQHEPLNMYVRQEMDIAALMMGEEMPDDAIDKMTSELFWTEEAIYQKMPMSDQWIRMDLTGMETMNMLTQMMQTNPQQSMELMDAFGMLTIFGDEKEIDGQDYYALSTYVDAETYRKVFEEMMGGLALGELVPQEAGMTDEEAAELQANINQVIDAMLETMTLDYYMDSYINQNTLLTERMDIDMVMSYTLDESLSPEGPITVSMKIIGSYYMHSFGEAVELPDVSDSITMEEMLLQQMQEME